jgi:hypothetical protein
MKIHISGSDHTALLIDSGEQAHLDNKAQFSFELSWLRVHELIAVEWEADTKGNSPIDICQNKIHHLRRFLKCCAKNRSGVYKKIKREVNDLNR